MTRIEARIVGALLLHPNITFSILMDHLLPDNIHEVNDALKALEAAGKVEHDPMLNAHCTTYRVIDKKITLEGLGRAYQGA